MLCSEDFWRESKHRWVWELLGGSLPKRAGSAFSGKPFCPFPPIIAYKLSVIFLHEQNQLRAVTTLQPHSTPRQGRGLQCLGSLTIHPAWVMLSGHSSVRTTDPLIMKTRGVVIGEQCPSANMVLSVLFPFLFACWLRFLRAFWEGLWGLL